MSIDEVKELLARLEKLAIENKYSQILSDIICEAISDIYEELDASPR